MSVQAPAIVLPFFAALWLALAIGATVMGLRRMRAAAHIRQDLRSAAELLAAAPMAPMLVHADGRIEADPRVGAWLGLDSPPLTFADFAVAGFEDDEIAALEQAVAEASAAARPITKRLPLPGSERVLCIHGSPFSGSATRNHSMLLWINDVSETQHHIAQLEEDVGRLGNSLNGLSTLIEAAPFPIWHRGADLQPALVNSAYVRAVEAESADDVVRRKVELIEAGNEGTPAAIAQATMERGLVTSRTAPAIIGGQRRMMRVVDVPIGTVGVAGFAMDVQELEDARADLGRFQQAQRATLDRLSAAVAQFGPDHALVFTNQHFQRLFLFEPEWLAERPEFDEVLERMREVQRAPESRDFRSWRADKRGWFTAADAAEEHWLLPGNMHLRVVAQPMPDGGLLLIFEDRTEHLQLASARDTLLRVRAATFDNLFEAVGVFAGDGRLQLWNTRFRETWDLEEAELVGHPRVDALVQTIAPKLLDPTRAGTIRELVRFATIERQHRSGRIALKNGRYYEFAAVPLPDGNALFTLLDITASRGIEEALRDRNEALEEANSLKNAFVASMSYELRVPLTSIAGFAEMLAAGYAGELDETARDYVAAILTAVSRLSALIGDVLDLSQSEAGSLPMATSPVAIAEVAREAAQIAAAAAASAGLSLQLDIAPVSGSVSGDAQRLRQCLDHLLRNAVQYTPAGGRVLLRTRTANDQAEIVVSDTGPGIAPANREHIFDRLGRARLARPADEGDGDGRPRAGIGLPFARQLVEAHGGTLVLDSEVGRGTRVLIRLPLLSEDDGDVAIV